MLGVCSGCGDDARDDGDGRDAGDAGDAGALEPIDPEVAYVNELRGPQDIAALSTEAQPGR